MDLFLTAHMAFLSREYSTLLEFKFFHFCNLENSSSVAVYVMAAAEETAFVVLSVLKMDLNHMQLALIFTSSESE